MKYEQKRWLFIGMLTLMNNVANCALYFESANEFLDHFNISDHRLSDLDKDTATEKCLFWLTLVLTLFLLYSNQTNYFWRIDQQLERPPADEYLPVLMPRNKKPSKPQSKTYRIGADMISALYKAMLASLSLAAFLKDQSKQAKIAIIFGAICFFGNFLSQLAIFLEPKLRKHHLNLSPQQAYWAVHLLTFLYNWSNTTLYFNAGDEFLHHLDIIDHRLIKGSTAVEHLGVLFLSFSSLLLLISTQRGYSRKVAGVLQGPENNNADKKDSRWHNAIEVLSDKGFIKFESYWSTGYKAFINYVSLVTTLYSFGANPKVSCVISAFCAPALILANYTVLKAEPSQREKLNAWLEQTIREPVCLFGMFYRSRQADPKGLQCPGNAFNAASALPSDYRDQL